MHLIVYASVCTLPLSQVQELLEEITAKSKVFNSELGVTGILVHEGGNFLQVIEGDEADVRLLFSKISADPRHHKISILVDEPVAERTFSGWEMDTFNLTHPDSISPNVLATLNKLYGSHFKMQARQLIAFLAEMAEALDTFRVVAGLRDKQC